MLPSGWLGPVPVFLSNLYCGIPGTAVRQSEPKFGYLYLYATLTEFSFISLIQTRTLLLNCLERRILQIKGCVKLSHEHT